MTELAEFADQINNHTDHLNDALHDLEKELRNTGIPVAAWIAEPIHDDPLTGDQWKMGYAMVGRMWRIAFVRISGGEKVIPVGIDVAPRHVRLAAMRHRDALVATLYEKAKAYRDEMLEATRKRSRTNGN
jgi:hypothetical protein